MAEAISKIGSPQIRNQGTVVGNVLTGRAAANARVSGMSLGATLKIRGQDCERTVNIGEKIRKEEFATSLRIPHFPSLRSSSYQSFTPRAGFAYASVSVAGSVDIKKGKFESVSLVGSPVLPPSARSDIEPCNSCAGSCRICEIQHFETIEQNLVGRPANDEEIIRTCELFNWQGIPMRDSIVHGSSAHRRHLLKVLSKKALISALERYQEIDRSEN
jgi:carbon-monoxide dehydrogenase medium subunit